MGTLTTYGNDVALSPISFGWRVWAPDPKGWRETRLHIAQQGEEFVLYERLGPLPLHPLPHPVVPARMVGVGGSIAAAVDLARHSDHRSKAEPRGSVWEMVKKKGTP